MLKRISNGIKISSPELKVVLKNILPSLIALAFIGGLVYAWTEPSQSPPGGNLGAPLNTSNLGQSKEGGLLLNTGGAANGLLVQGGNVGFGTLAPTTPAPNAQTGNLDVNDIFLRSTGTWLSSISGLTYTYYCYSDSGKGTPVCSNAGGTQGYCPAGFKQEMALGDWGFCYMSPGYPYVIYWDLVPGGHCGSGSWTAGNVYGSAYVCSKI